VGVSIVQVLISEKTRRRVGVSNSLWKKWKLSANEFYTLSFGGRSLKTRLRRMKGKADELVLPLAQSSDLLLPFSKQVQATFKNNIIKIGPVIGLLTDIHPNYKSMFHEILQSKDYTSHYCFVFSPTDINWGKGEVMGWFFDGKDEQGFRWKKHTLPLPDVIYNRITYRSVEKSAEVKSLFRMAARHSKVKIFNPSFFSKQGIHRLLKNHPLAKDFLPDTRFSAVKRSITQLLAKHDEVFVKPGDGAEGLGIYKISKAGEGFSCHTERRITHFGNLEDLLTAASTEDWKRRYIVQQGIQLIQYNGRNIDFRVNLNKNIANNWVVSGVAGKAAGSESVTTHVRLGGQVYRCGDILNLVFGERSEEFRIKMESAAVTLAQAIEEEIGKPVGELGLDIGIDQDGRVWMFEANSKPGRSIFRYPGMEEEAAQSINLLFEYSYFLAGFGTCDE